MPLGKGCSGGRDCETFAVSVFNLQAPVQARDRLIGGELAGRRYCTASTQPRAKLKSSLQMQVRLNIAAHSGMRCSCAAFASAAWESGKDHSNILIPIQMRHSYRGHVRMNISFI